MQFPDIGGLPQRFAYTEPLFEALASLQSPGNRMFGGTLQTSIVRMITCLVGGRPPRNEDLNQDWRVQEALRRLVQEQGMVVVLGSDDPERRALVERLCEIGMEFVYAKAGNEQVLPYEADRPTNSPEVAESIRRVAKQKGSKVVYVALVECRYNLEMITPPGITVIPLWLDHHHDGQDYGARHDYKYYWQGSPLGLFLWAFGITPTKKELTIMAIDHCYAAALAGLCVGVTPDDALHMDCFMTAQMQAGVSGWEAEELARDYAEEIKKLGDSFRRAYFNRLRHLILWDAARVRGGNIARPEGLLRIKSGKNELVLCIGPRIWDKEGKDMGRYLKLRSMAYYAGVPLLLLVRRRDGSWGAMVFLQTGDQVETFMDFVRNGEGESFGTQVRMYAGADRLPKGMRTWIEAKPKDEATEIVESCLLCA